MGYVAATIVLIASIAGVAMTVLALPGVWVMIGVAILCDLWRPELFSLWTLLIAVALGALGEIAEFLASGVGAKRAGGSRAAIIWSAIGAITGGIVGTIFLPIPVLGTIVGGVIGAGLLAGVAERTLARGGWAQAWQVARGAARGRAVAVIVKTAMAILTAMLLSVAAFVG